MERIVEQSEKDALAALSSVKAQSLLKYVLSPVETAAVQHRFQSFQFNVNGKEIYISAQNSRRLLFLIKYKLDLLTFLEIKEQKSGNIPLNLRDVFDFLAYLRRRATAYARINAIPCIPLCSLAGLFCKLTGLWQTLPGVTRRFVCKT